jgi:hypothetical protein
MARVLAPRLRRRSTADDGMSVLEVVIAMAILLFVMAALWALMLASTALGQDAKARALAVETANGYIEMVRALPYADIGVSGGTPTGTLVSPKDYTQGGLNVRVVPTVSWEVTASPTYKILTIQVTVTSNGRQLASYRAKTYIRDRRSGVTVNVTDPAALFIDPSPANAAIVWGNTDVTMKGDSSGNSPDWGVPLGVMSIVGNDIVLTGSVVASWTAPASTYLSTKSVTWNTDAGSWGDGSVTLVAEARNTFGMVGIDTRYVIVDNHAPDVAPSAVSAVPTATATSVPVQWTQSTDGSLEVPRYLLTVYTQGTSSSEDLSSWAAPTVTYETPAHAGTTVPYTLTTSPFSRYVLGVKGCGPRWNASSLPTWTSAEARSAAFYSRPVLSVAGAGDHDHTFSVTPPTFPTSGLTYSWYRDTNSGAGWTGWNLVTTTTDPTYHAEHMDEHLYRFRVKVDFTPTSGVATTIGSQVITQLNNHDYTFSAAPDWTPWW